MEQKELLEKLKDCRRLEPEQWRQLIDTPRRDAFERAQELAQENQRRIFGRQIYVRGLIEISSYCKNNCYYCGIRRGNAFAERYRLTAGEIFSCVRRGFELGFRTFVLQGGEDGYYSDEVLEPLICRIKECFPDCAVTLSLGERSRESYSRLRQAGTDRYLLRHETADRDHYANLHPKEMSWERRIDCLWQLKELGYQVGCGFMVGSPGQTADTLAEDMMLLQKFQPQMVGIGPFIPHRDTPFMAEAQGSVEQTLYLLSLIRILLPEVLLPATTALGTLDPAGREKGILAGANVLMPNLSPEDVREKYELYDDKLCAGDEAAESLGRLRKRIKNIGYEIVTDRGDAPAWGGETYV